MSARAYDPSADPVDDPECDFWVQDHGTIFLLIPKTDAAQEWVDEYLLPGQELTYWGSGIAVEHRYIRDIVEGIRGDGLEVE